MIKKVVKEKTFKIRVHRKRPAKKSIDNIQKIDFYLNDGTYIGKLKLSMGLFKNLPTMVLELYIDNVHLYTKMLNDERYKSIHIMDD